MTIKNIIGIGLSVAIIHFAITSLIGHYIAVQIGTQIGHMVIGGLSAVSDNTKSETEATTIFQNMKSQSNEIKAKWKIPELIISLPAKPLINALIKDMRQNQMNKYIAKKITREQFKTRGLITDYTVNLLNSMVLGLLIYIAIKMINQKINRVAGGN